MIVEYLAAAITVALYSFACLSLGTALIGLLAGRRDILSQWEPLAATGSAFLLGQGVLAAVWTLLSVQGLFTPELVLAGTGIALFVGARPGMRLLRRFGQRLRAALRALRADSPGWRLVGLLTLVLIGMIGLATLLPPRPRSDALAFYMSMPRLLSNTHYLIAPPGYETFSKIGLQGELHFAALITLSSTSAAKLFVWPLSLAAGLLLLGLGREGGLGRHAKWATLAALFTSTALTNVIWDGKVDAFGSAMGLVTLYWALQTSGEHHRLAVRLTGLFAGLAVIAKISNLLILAPGVALLVIWQWAANQPPGTRFSRLALRSLLLSIVELGLWAGLAMLPHVLKNALLFGEPLAPFISADTAEITNQVWFSPATTQRILLTYPLALVYGSYWAQAGRLTPLVLAFAPLLLVLPRPRPVLRSKLLAIGLAGLLGVAVWMILRPSVLAPRYILASLLVLILPVARAAERYALPPRTRSLWASAAIVPALVAVLLITAYPFIYKDLDVYRLATDQLAPCDLEVSTMDASCRVANVLAETAAPGERTFLGTYYTYWLRADLIQCANTGFPDDLLTPEARWAYLIEQGYHYLIIDQLTHGWLIDQLALTEPPDWLDLELLYDGQLDVDDNPFLAYRISSTDSSHQAQIACTQIDSSRWQAVSVTSPDSAQDLESNERTQTS